MIDGERVRQAREFERLTQDELARAVGVTQPLIANIEAGLRQPSPDVLNGMVLATGFPPAFFRQEAPPHFALGSLLFRARKKLSAKDRDRVKSYGALAYESVARMATRVERHIDRVHLPQLDAKTPADQAAALVRSALGLSPDRPIGNLINKLELNGVTVISLPLSIPDHDAFSVWSQGPRPEPVIVLASGVPGDRLRFTVSHELGHLVLHAAHKGSVAPIEKEAMRFASAFLLPREAMMREMQVPVTLGSLLPMKPRWGVAVQALVMRAQDIGLITSRQVSYLFRQIALHGWRKNEPMQIEPEKPRGYRRMAELLYGDPVDSRRLRREMVLPAKVVDPLLATHAVLGDMPVVEPTRSSKIVQLKSS